MNPKMQLILALAESCHEQGTTLPVKDLAGRLNAAGHLTNYGTQYQGLRGTYTLIRAVFWHLHRAGRTVEARRVAAAFTRPNGTYAYVY